MAKGSSGSRVTGVRHVYRSTFWRIVSYVWIAVLVVSTWDIVARGFPRAGLQAFAVMGALSVVVYAIGWRPEVVATPKELVVRNPLRTTTFPWASVTEIDVSFGLRVQHQGGLVRAFAVERGGAAANTLRGMTARRQQAVPGVSRETLSAMARVSPADVAAGALREMWRQERANSRGRARTTWAWPLPAAAVVLAVVAVLLG